MAPLFTCQKDVSNKFSRLFFLSRPSCEQKLSTMVKKKKKERFRSHEETTKKALIRVDVELKIVVRHLGNVKYTYKMQLIYRITLRIQRILKCSVMTLLVQGRN